MSEEPRKPGSFAPIALGIALMVLLAVVVHRLRKPGGDDANGGVHVVEGRTLAVFGPVPEVALTDRFTRPFRFETLKGRVTVVNFFFTTCPGPCIPLTRNVRLLVSTFRAEPNVGFASVSVDPAADTPDQLTTFARAQGGEFPRWDWLTGTREEIVKTCRGFFAPFGEKNKEGEILHSTKLFVVDQEGRLRSAIDTQND